MIAGFILALVALAAASPFVSAATPIGAATKLVAATVCVGVLPGGALTLLWRPRPTLGLLEWLALSIALSFGIVHLITVIIILVHASVVAASIALLMALAAGGALLWLRRHSATTLRFEMDDVVGLAILAVLAVCLYQLGSPVADWEDQVHVSIVRRLAALDRLTLDNFYLTPHVVYTYPFPSTHAFMALVAKIGGIDALFVYHKLRFFWGPAGILMLYLGARAIFAARPVATATLVSAAALTLTGMFAVVEGSYWGQLATFSHASDVAMAVLLPALLALSWRFIDSDIARERQLLLIGAMGLAFTLTVVHIREVIQYVAYLCCFVLVAAFCVPFRDKLRRSLLLLGGTIAVAAVFLVWHGRVVVHVADLVKEQQEKVAIIARATSAHDLLLAPAARVLPSFVLWFDAAFNGVTPLLMFAGPIAIVAYRQRPLVWLVAASSVAYLLVMNIPALAIPYIYLTYSEILITPIRNLTPFLQLLAGPVLYLVAISLWALVRPPIVATIVVVTGGVALGLLGSLAPVAVNQSEARFFVPATLSWIATFLHLTRHGPLTRLTSARIGLLLVVGAVCIAALWPDRSPRKIPPVVVNLRWAEGVSDMERVALERRFSLAELQRTDDPNTRVYDIRDISRDNVKALVTSPRVVDTFHINRTTFEADDAPRRPWYGYPNRLLLIFTAAGLWLCGLVLPTAIASGSAIEANTEQPPSPRLSRSMVPFALVAVPFFVLTFSPTLSVAIPTPVKPFNTIITKPADLLPQISCTERYNVAPPLAESHTGEAATLKTLMSCPPDQDVADWVRTHVPVNAVFAIDRWNGFMPTVFLPQQILTFSGLEFSLPNEREIYPAYVRWYRTSMRDRGVQPFFNDRETATERKAFLTDLGATHVLLDPQYYWTLRPILDALPRLFARRFDNGRWAVYEVNQSVAGDALD